MNFAENNRISHRQLYRQVVLSFLAPFLICLFEHGKSCGIGGLLGMLLALVLEFFYVIFLIRLQHSFSNPYKSAGKIGSRVVGLFFGIYCVLAAAFLLNLLGEIVEKSLGTGISSFWLQVLALIICTLGTGTGMQRRGRMAEVSGKIVLAVVIFMLLLSVQQGKWEYFQEMFWNSPVDGKTILETGYALLCGFSALSLLPFGLDQVEKNGSAGKTVRFAVLTLGAILLAIAVLFPAVFGWGRLKQEATPILPLLAGADLPGNVLARFDVLWMGFLLYSLLFSIGSLVYYGRLIVDKTHLGKGSLWICFVILILLFVQTEITKIQSYFWDYVKYVFVPGLLILQAALFFLGKHRRKKKRSPAAFLCICLGITMFLSGCGGVEPEKRMYPLALGLDRADGKFVVTYGNPNLPKATGQEKTGEEQQNQAPMLAGETFEAVEYLYDRTQEKHLDMGHLEILVLGRSLLEGNGWQEALTYLKRDPVIGENVYVFAAESASDVVGWVSPLQTSSGEYLKGLLENEPNGSGSKQTVTLREVYHEWYERGDLPHLPEIQILEKCLEVVF